MEKNETDKLPDEEMIEREEEEAEKPLPFDKYGEDSTKLRSQIKELERDYDEREKVIDRIMEYGTGIESEKALRMYPTSTLQKWESSLEAFHSSQLKK
jgi:hypothetical protein